MFKHRGVDGGQGTCIPVHAHRFHPGKEKKILAVTYNNNPSLTIKEHEGGEGGWHLITWKMQSIKSQFVKCEMYVHTLLLFLNQSGPF